MSWRSLNGHSVIWFEDQVGLGPLHPGLRLACHLGREFDLAASLGGETSQQLGIQLDLWRFCKDDKEDSEVMQV